MVIQQIKAVLLSIIKLFRRIMCCFSFGRRRKHSLSEPIEIKIVVEGGRATLPVGAQSPNYIPLSQTQHVNIHANDK